MSLLYVLFAHCNLSPAQTSTSAHLQVRPDAVREAVLHLVEQLLEAEPVQPGKAPLLQLAIPALSNSSQPAASNLKQLPTPVAVAAKAISGSKQGTDRPASPATPPASRPSAATACPTTSSAPCTNGVVQQQPVAKEDSRRAQHNQVQDQLGHHPQSPFTLLQSHVSSAAQVSVIGCTCPDVFTDPTLQQPISHSMQLIQ